MIELGLLYPGSDSKLTSVANLNSIYASLIACLVTSVGIWSIKYRSEWAKRNSIYFISFAAGVIISVSFVHIIPRSLSMSANAHLCLLAGFMGLYLVNRLLNIFFCQDSTRKMMSTGIVSIIAIGLHSFIDGVIYSITYRTSILTGALATAGMILHEFPEGIVTYLVLENSGFDKKKATMLAIIAAALTTPLGAIASFPLVGRITEPQLGSVLGLSAGFLVYLGATHLLPSVEKEHKAMTIVSLLAGIIAAIFIMLWGD